MKYGSLFEFEYVIKVREGEWAFHTCTTLVSLGDVERGLHIPIIDVSEKFGTSWIKISPSSPPLTFTVQ